jgi:hypothetical protein
MEVTDVKTYSNIQEKKQPAKQQAKQKMDELGDEDLNLYGIEKNNMDGMEPEDEEFRRLEFKFRHSGNNSEIFRFYKVKVIQKSFVNVDYNYKLVCMIPDDDNINDWDGEDDELKILQADDDSSEESHISLPNVVTERVAEGTNLLRSQQETFKFMNN